jgi:hypothetical protein
MSDRTFRVVHCADNSFAVEELRSRLPPRIVATFVTEAEAIGWIEQDRRLRDAADPFTTPSGRRARRV